MKKLVRTVFLILFASISFLFSCQKQKDYAPEISALQASLNSLQQKCDSLSTILNNTNSSLQTTNNNVSNLTKSLDSVKTEISTIVSQISTLNVQLTTTNANVAAINAQIATLNGQLNNLVAELNTIIALLNENSGILPANLTNGLIAWYPFNGNTNDLSGNNNNGVNNGATLIADRFGNANSAYSFNGTSSYISCPSLSVLNNTNNLTLSAWVKITGVNNNNYGGSQAGGYVEYLISRGKDTDPGHFGLGFSENQPPNANPPYQFFSSINSSTSSNSGAIISTDTFTVPQAAWHHVVMTYNGSITILYVDGKNEGSLNYNLLITTDTNPVYFGRNQDPYYSYYLNGNLDDIGIWNRALSAQEVQQLLNL